MQKARAYWRVFLTSAREDGANPKRLISTVLQMIGRVLLVVAIYKVAYGATGGNHALTFTNAMWTIGLCFAYFLNLGIRNIYQPVEREIKDGSVETSLIKPLDWRAVKFLQLLGKSGVEFLIQLVVLPTVLLIVVGPPDVGHLSPGLIAVFVLILFMSVVTAGALFLTVGLTAFWLNDAKSVFRIVDKMALICCGTFVPLALMPDVMQWIVRFTPFNIYAAPTRLFDPTFVPMLVPTLIGGVVWMFLMLALCQFVWNRAGRKIEVNGG
ncbi:MAG TPA: ABC-2 family transporter protein [Candidatus Saccharimonadales bacterium]|nr:ABC-2 family transporter protein [Candidatus Saccharimonadales bacterium]